MTRPNRAERGQITGFVAITIVGLLMAAGLAFDGGRILAGRRDANDIARAAARAGAQTRNPRTNTLEPTAAAAQANTYLTQHGYTGTVAVQRDTITVTVRRRVDMAILPIAARTVTGRATATAVEQSQAGP
ncbi:MAG TPA: pilus assembly protein TadG-related protein [Acidimicrobiales bacterium]|jgi:Flp pilus assembly protein TadG|nr:pilus assembly protein TadG-related protein [Acidimicrobiales bacterium]